MKRSFSKQCLGLLLAGVMLVTSTACSTDQVLSTIDVALQTAANLATAVGAVSPADAAILESLTGLATAGLNAIQKDYDTYKASKAAGDLAKLQAAIAALQSNLAQNLSAARIASPTAVTKTTAWVTLIATSLDVVSTTILAATSPKAMAPRTAQLPTPESLQARWQMEVCSGDTKCGALVKAKKKHAKSTSGGGFWNAVGQWKFGGGGN